MKINEIMHGFWLYHPEYGNVQVEDFDNDFGDEPCVVVYSESIPHKDGYVYGYRYVGLDELYPLPLTAEILENNGFKLEEYTGNCMVGKWWTRNDFVIPETMIDSVGRNNFVYQYVHQLQIALRICGADKEIIV